MKVSELQGAQLDYWVGRAAGWHPTILGGRCMQGRETSHEWIEYEPWSPSTDWAIGGRVIERERISINLYGCGREWGAWTRGSCYETDAPDGTGATPLIAAMRAYVASKFGWKVES